MTANPVHFLPSVLALVIMAVPATAQNQNNSIPGIDVVVKKQPTGAALRLGATDARGQVSFDTEVGSYALLLPAVQAAREAVRRSAAGSPPPGGVVARVEVGRAVQTSAPLMLDGRGEADFMGPDGRQMVVATPRGGRVRVTLVPCCWASDPRGPVRSGPALREGVDAGSAASPGGRFVNVDSSNRDLDRQSATLNHSGATIAAETRVPNGAQPVEPVPTREEPPTSNRASSAGEHRDGPSVNRLRVINNSETDTAQVEESQRVGPGETPVNGIGGQGGGRLSNRDHIDQDAQGHIRAAPSAPAGSTGPVNGIGGTGGGRFTFTPAAGGRVAIRGATGAVLPIGTTNREGQVSTTLRAEPGAYEVTVACPARAPCRLASVAVDDRNLTADANGRFVLTVQPGASSLRVSADVSTIRVDNGLR